MGKLIENAKHEMAYFRVLLVYPETPRLSRQMTTVNLQIGGWTYGYQIKKNDYVVWEA